MTPKQTLLSYNRKALQGLHKVFGMDFQKPYTIIAGDDNFTVRSLWKELYKAGVTNAHDYRVVVLMDSKRDYHTKHLEVVQLYDAKFDINIPKGGYSFDFDTFVSVGLFEETRRHFIRNFWVVAQEYQHIVPTTHAPADLADRLHVVKYVYTLNPHGDTKYIDIDCIQGNQHYRIRCNSEEVPVDKSGYLLSDIHKNYKIRAELLRRQKSKEQADKASVSAEYTDELEYYERFKDIVKSKLIHAFETDNEEAEDILLSLYRRLRHTINSTKEDIKNKAFKDMKELNYRFIVLEDIYNKLISALEEINGMCER